MRQATRCCTQSRLASPPSGNAHLTYRHAAAVTAPAHVLCLRLGERCGCSCRSFSGIEAENWFVHRLGCTRGIEILTQERDLPARGTQEHYILLTIHALRRLDERLGLHLCDRRVWIGEGMHLEIEEADVIHRPPKTGEMTR